MKKFLLLSLTFILGVVVYTQAIENPLTVFSAQFKWEKTTHEFGKIPQGKPVTAVFEFTNTGSSPLIITNAKGSCGCTVPQYTKDPIAPGATGTIKAVFNAASVGAFTKTVTVTANTDKPAVLYIKGEVIKQ